MKGKRMNTATLYQQLKLTCLFLPCLVLTGCNLPQKMAEVGETPQLSHITNPTKVVGYQPVSMPMPPTALPPEGRSPSLWQDGAQAFFKDQRANKVGDIVTVNVLIDQKESIDMKPEISRESKGKTVVNNLMGLEKQAKNLFPKAQGGVADWINLSSKPELKSSAKYEVTDKLQFKLAATIVQILPNGNMVLAGRQEVRLVNEVREIMVQGIVRREDISSANAVNQDKISELRIAYGGRGDLSDMQRFPWGQEVLNKVMPF